MQSDADIRTSFKDVNLNGAKIKGQLNMSGASFDGELDAETCMSTAICACNRR